MHLLHIFPTFAVGGSQTRFAQLVRAHGSRYRHTVIALDGVRDMASRIPDDIAIEYRTLSFDKRRVWSNLLLFRRTIDEIRPDVLVTYNWGAIEWALANRGPQARKHIHIEDGFGPDETSTQLRRRVWGRRLALSGDCTTIVVPSRGLEKKLVGEWGFAANRVRFIPNGIDCERFWVDVGSRKQKSGPVIVGTVANLRPEKNISRLIMAFCGIAERWPRGGVQLLIVGDGPDRAMLKELALKRSDAGSIRFVGPTPDPQDWLQKMDVFALSSDTEQMPFSVLEAMASGLPLVSTAVGDVPDLVAAENAPQIIPLGDEAAFRKALAQLVTNGELRHAIGQANQKKARALFDLRLMSERYADLFG